MNTITIEGASCAFWWRERMGMIGRFEATSLESTRALLRKAEEALRRQGCTQVVAPMDGSTWRSYRFVTEAGSEPPFFLEPAQPPAWPEWFRACGYEPVARYRSLLNADLTREDPRLPRLLARYAEAGITFRSLDPARWDEELRAVHRVASRAFTSNFLYTPLDEASFRALYEPLRAMVKPEFFFLAERSGELVAFLFTLPDYAEAQRGEPIRTVVGKTLASLPGRAHAGLGIALTGLLQRRARELGYTRVIHALQHAGNVVGNMSRCFGEVMRGYTLFARRLEP